MFKMLARLLVLVSLIASSANSVSVTSTSKPVLATRTSSPPEMTSTLSAQITVLDRSPQRISRAEQPRAGRDFGSDIPVTAKPISVGRSAGSSVDDLGEQSLAALFPQIYGRLASNTIKNSQVPEQNPSERLWNLLGQSILERRREFNKPTATSTTSTTSTTTTSTTSTTVAPSTPTSTRRVSSLRPTRAEKKADKTKDISANVLTQLLEELQKNSEIKDFTVRQLHRHVLFDMIRMALGNSSSVPPLQRTVVVSEPERTLTPSTTTSSTTTTTEPPTIVSASSEEMFEEVHREGFVDVEHVGADRVCLFYKGMGPHKGKSVGNFASTAHKHHQLVENDPTLIQFSQQVQDSWDEFVEKVRHVAKGSWEYMAKQMSRSIHNMV